MQKQLWAAAVVAASMAMGTAAKAEEADHDVHYMTVCLWNDTADDVKLKIHFAGYQEQSMTLGAAAWGSFAMRLNGEEAPAEMPALTVKFNQGPGVDTYGDEMTLTPLLTTSRNCSQLRGLNLHYEFKAMPGEGGASVFSLRGPTVDP